MTYEKIVAKVKEYCDGAELNGYSSHLAVELEITGEGEGVFYAEAINGKLHVE